MGHPDTSGALVRFCHLAISEPYICIRKCTNQWKILTITGNLGAGPCVLQLYEGLSLCCNVPFCVPALSAM
jgi:hypothetical protein